MSAYVIANIKVTHPERYAEYVKLTPGSIAPYGGRFIVRGFSGDSTFRMNGRGEPNAAINKASGVGASVTQEIALSVKGDKIECAINGQVVGSYDKSAAVGEKKLKSTNGVYGIRFGHNTDAVVKGLALTKQ